MRLNPYHQNVTGVKGSIEDNFREGDVDISKSNLGLSEVRNEDVGTRDISGIGEDIKDAISNLGTNKTDVEDSVADISRVGNVFTAVNESGDVLFRFSQQEGSGATTGTEQEINEKISAGELQPGDQVVILDDNVDVNAAAVSTYGTCVTESDVAEKVVIIENLNWAAVKGAQVVVKYTYTNTAENPTLNVNGTGNIPVYCGESIVSDSDLDAAGHANRYIKYIFDGSVWVYIGESVRYESEIESINELLTDSEQDTKFKFGIDENGEYGYIKKGEISVTPFRTKHTETVNPNSRALLDMGINHKVRYVNLEAVPNINGLTYTFPANHTGTTVDMGGNNTYRYVNAQNVYNKGVSDGRVGYIVTPTATKSITSNGNNQDVLNYAKVNVSVPNSNSGTYNVTSNGTKDMGATNNYRYVNVDVHSNPSLLNYSSQGGGGGTMSMNLSGHYAYVISAASGQGGEFSASGDGLSISKTAEVSGIYSNLAMFVVYGTGTITIGCSSWVRCLACVCVDAG